MQISPAAYQPLPVGGAALGEKAQLKLTPENLQEIKQSALERRLQERDTVTLSAQDASDRGIVILNDSAIADLTKRENAKLSTTFTGESVSDAARRLSYLMDENDENIRMKTNFGMSREQLAEHFGSIGRQLDDAFAAGSISRQEYDDLNRGLETYTQAVTSRAERMAASWEVLRQNARSIWEMAQRGVSKEEMDAYAKEIRDTLQDRITEFVKKHCSIDRSALAKLIQQVREGQSLFPEGTKQTYGRENTRDYFKNGYVPFVSPED